METVIHVSRLKAAFVIAADLAKNASGEFSPTPSTSFGQSSHDVLRTHPGSDTNPFLLNQSSNIVFYILVFSHLNIQSTATYAGY